MLTPILLSLAARAACPDRTASTSDLETALTEARRALERLDTGAFVAANDRLDGLLPCLGEPLSRHLAAELHRTKGIRAVTERNPDAERYFAAARAIEPAYKFPSTLIPEGNPVRTSYAAFDLTKGGFDALAPPRDGTLTLDGATKLYRPTDWPTVAQYMSAEGAIQWTEYLAPGTPFPEYPAGDGTAPPVDNPLLLVAPVPVVPVPPPPRSAKVPLAVGSLAGALLTGALYGLAGFEEARFKNPDTPDAELDTARSSANSLVVVSVFTGSATVGLGVAALAVR